MILHGVKYVIIIQVECLKKKYLHFFLQVEIPVVEEVIMNPVMSLKKINQVIVITSAIICPPPKKKPLMIRSTERTSLVAAAKH